MSFCYFSSVDLNGHHLINFVLQFVDIAFYYFIHCTLIYFHLIFASKDVYVQYHNSYSYV